MIKLTTLADFNNLRSLLNDVYDYETDNSCSDPDCCDPYISDDEYYSAVDSLKNSFNIDVTEVDWTFE